MTQILVKTGRFIFSNLFNSNKDDILQMKLNVNKAPANHLAESPLARKNLAQGGSRKSHTAKPLLVLWFYSRNKIFYWNTGIAYPQLDEVLNVDSCICDIFNRLRNSNSTFLSLFFSSFPFCCAFIGASYTEGALRAGLAQLGEQ